MRRPLGSRATTIFALVLGALRAEALDPTRAITQYGHTLYTVDQGLPQNSIQALLQTRDGFLWVGTQEGLARFDGLRFTLFDEKAQPAFKDHDVQTLCEDKDGALWIGTQGGLVRLKDGVFTAYDRASGLSSNRIISLFVDSKGRLWVGTDAGLSRFENDRFVTPLGLSAQPYVVLAMAEMGGAMWFATDSHGLVRLTDAVETFTMRDGLASNVVSALLAARNGVLWVGTRAGINRIEGGRITTVSGPWSDGTQPVSAMVEDRHGNVWIGTRSGGVSRLSGGRIETHSEADGLSGSIVLSVYEDREGSLWVGTDGQGLNQLRDVKLAAYGKPEGLGQEMLLPILEDKGGTLWLGSYGGGLQRFEGGRFRRLGEEQGLRGKFLTSLVEDRSGNLWIGTDDAGLFQMRHGLFRQYPQAPDGLPSNRVVALLEDRQGALWIGTFGGGLARLQNGRFTRYARDQGLSGDLVLSIAEDEAGRLWIGTEGGGLNLLEGGRFKAYTTEQGLGQNVVLCLHPDADGVLWIGTTGGLTRFKDGKFVNIARAQGLFDDRVFQILEQEGTFWISCNRGIFRVAKKDLDDLADGRQSSVVSVAYGHGDGMRVAECNGKGQPAGWKAKDGTLWFPTPRGAVRVDPKNFPRNGVPPSLAFDDVVINRRRYEASGTLLVPPGNGELEIHYIGVSFLEPEKIRFKYRLVGFDRDWIDAGSRRVAYYTNIPPDRYQFEVTAANNDGVWNEKAASLVLQLRPHFYQAAWFRGIALLATLGTGFSMYQWRLRRLVAQKVELTRLVEERTRQLQEVQDVLAEMALARNRAAAIEIVGRVWGARPSEGSFAGATSTANSTLALIGPNQGISLPPRYELVRLLGQGGMGSVYLARDHDLDEVIAVKVLLKADAATGRDLELFRSEVKLARQVTHPHVVRTFELGESCGQPFITMEYVEGPSLKEVIQGTGALPLGVGSLLCGQIAEGLAAAQKQGVLHRDIKPHNVLVSPQTGEAKLSDFGIARRVGVQGGTARGLIVGTPAYMAPEQSRGQEATFESDIYSFGVLLFEVFTGRVPFLGRDSSEVMRMHREEAPCSPRTINGILPEGLEALILRCLRKEAGERFQTVDEIIRILRAFATRTEREAAVPRFEGHDATVTRSS